MPMKKKFHELSQRQLRVGEELRHALSEIFSRGIMRDKDLVGRSITVTEVRPAPDLRSASVYVTQLGGGESSMLLAALVRCAPFLTAEISKRVYLKFSPRLKFEIDRSFDRMDRIESLLRLPEVSRDLEVKGDSPRTSKD